MDPDASPGRPAVRPSTEALLLVGGVLACLAPYLGRLAHPSLYTDDVTRIIQLRAFPFGRLLLLRFNEHVCPLFQLVSWLTWRCAGGELARAPLAFTLVSYVPFVLVLGLLARSIRSETGSTLTALAVLPVFGLSWLSSETVYWYSASSFMWALALTLVAWLGASSTADRRPVRGAVATGVASALAPAFSAIGLLAGPLAALRVLEAGRPRRLVAVASPIAGMLAYLAFAWAVCQFESGSSGLHATIQLRAGLLASFRAPVDHLLPGLLGLRPGGLRLPDAAGLGLAAVLLALTLWGARRSPHRALILGGLWLILGGYALTFCPRCDEQGRFAQRIGQRYHLFPQLGLAFVLAPALKAVLRRTARRPGPGLLAVLAWTAALFATHDGGMKTWGRYFRFPDQPRTLAAIDRLGSICDALGITRDQALAALDPIEPSWTTPGLNALEMLWPSAAIPAHPDAQVRSLLLDALTTAERQSICGGMDASPYLRPDDERGDLVPWAVGRLEGSFRVRPAGEGRRVSVGKAGFLQYEFRATDGDAADPGDVRALGLPPAMPGATVEVWWRDDREGWSETRSVRCVLRPSRVASTGRGWILDDDRLPHWDPGSTRHLRLLFRTPGIASVGPPRLLRRGPMTPGRAGPDRGASLGPCDEPRLR